MHLDRLDRLDLCASDVPTLTRTPQRHLGERVVRVGHVLDAAGVANPGAAFAFR